MRKFLVGMAIVVGLLGQASPADASLRSLKKDCRAGDQQACEKYAYERCVAEAKDHDLDPDVCDDYKP